MAPSTSPGAAKKRPHSDVEPLEKIGDPFLNDKLVTIALEDSEERFTVSKALLCHASDYFRKALDGHDREGKDSILRLPAFDEPTLRLFISFITCKALPDIGLQKTQDGNREQCLRYQAELVKLWSFGGFILVPKLQNVAMRALDRVMTHTPFAHNRDRFELRMGSTSPEVLQLAFESTSKDSAIRNMLVRRVVGSWRDQVIHEEALELYGEIPGFFMAFARDLRVCPLPGEDCMHEDLCPDTLDESVEQFIVAED